MEDLLGPEEDDASSGGHPLDEGGAEGSGEKAAEGSAAPRGPEAQGSMLPSAVTPDEDMTARPGGGAASPPAAAGAYVSPAAGEALAPGQAVEARYGEGFFDAEVVGPGASAGLVRVRYGCDGSEAELAHEDVRPKPPATEGPAADAPEAAASDAAAEGVAAAPAAALPAAAAGAYVGGAAPAAAQEAAAPEAESSWTAAAPEPAAAWGADAAASSWAEAGAGAAEAAAGAPSGSSFEAGQAVKAKFGNSHFEATVVSVGEGTVKVTYKYDGSEAELPVADVLPAEEAAAEAAPAAAEVAEEEPPGAVSVDVGWQATEYLLADGGWRAQLIEGLAGAKVKAEESGNVKLWPGGEDGGEASVARARCLLNAVKAAKAGEDAEGLAPPEGADDGLPRSAFTVPKAAREVLFGALIKLMDDNRVIAGIAAKPAQEPAAEDVASATVELAAGQKVEAKFGNSFFSAEVVEVGEENVKVKYDYDGSEVDVPKAEVRPKPPDAAPSAQASGELAAGDVVEAKFGNSFFEAEVVEVTDSGVKVKYKYDGSETELPKDDVKAKDKPKQIETELLHVVGEARARANFRVNVYRVLVHKGAMTPDFFVGLTDDPGDAPGVGFRVVTNVGRCVGPQGKMKKKLMSVTRTLIEYPGTKDWDGAKYAVFAGSGEERTQLAFLLEVVQSLERGSVTKIPECFGPATLYILRCPDQAMGALLGTKRGVLNQLEEELEFLSITMPEGYGNPGAETAVDFEPAVDLKVQAHYSGKWHDATVVEVLTPAEGETSGAVKIRWGYDGSEAEVARSDLRPIAEGEALAARERADKLATFKVQAIFANDEKMKPAIARLMAIVEESCPGTYIAQDGGTADVALSEEQVALLTADMAKRAEEKKWDDKGSGNSWDKDKGDQKWEGDKWAAKKEEKSWGDKKDAGWAKKDEKSWGDKKEDSWSKKDDKSWGDKKEDKWAKKDDKAWGSDKAWDKKEEPAWGGDKKTWGGGDSGAWGSQEQPAAQQAGGWDAAQDQKRGWEAQGADYGGADKRPRYEQPAYGAYPGQEQPQQQVVAQPQVMMAPQEVFAQQMQPQMQAMQSVGPCDTYARMLQYGIPSTVEEWTEHQGFFFEGHPPLPPGWIRVWSKSRNREYYVRLADNRSMFEWNEMLEAAGMRPIPQ